MPVMPVLGRQWGALGTGPKSVGTDPKYNGDRLYIWRLRDSLIPRILVNIRLRVLNLKKS